MRILIVHDYGRRIGGGEHMALALADGLKCRGHEVQFFASCAAPVPAPLECDHACFGTMSPLRRLTQVANPDAALRLRRVIRDFRPDLVHVRMFLSQLSPLILPVLRGVHSLLHVITYEAICPLDTKTLPDGSPCRHRAGAACRDAGCLGFVGAARTTVQHGLARRWWGVFDRVIANSAWVQGRLLGDGVRCDGFVWNGVPARPPRPPLADPPSIGFAGRLVAKKGVDALLTAFSRLPGRLADARLLIAGDGPERPALEAQAAALGIAPRVEFLGHAARDDVERRLEPTWVRAVPSLWEEPFGIAAAEAMMRGTAVVCSRTGGLSEQVLHGRTGRLVSPGDADALANALAAYLADRDLAERHGTAARARALEEFTEDRFVERILAVYREMLDAPRPAAAVPLTAAAASPRPGPHPL